MRCVRWTTALLAWAVLAASGCYGGAGDQTGSDGEESDSGSPADPPEDPDEAAKWGVQGLRRLSRYELANAVRDLVGPFDPALLEFVPSDELTPFDNDYGTQVASQAYVDGLKAFADGLSEEVFIDADRRDSVLGCSPAGVDDEACLRQFIEAIGLRAYRRPLSSTEVDEFATLLEFASDRDDFYVAPKLVLQAIIQDPEFLHRIEIGREVDGFDNLRRLTSFEVASRLSFLLWGTVPDKPLLELAMADGLEDREQIRETAETMLADPRAMKQFKRLHALWLEYDRLDESDALRGALRRETDALVERSLDSGEWTLLFTSDETFVDETLADHYGLPAPAGTEGWVIYPDARRQGVLSHGSFAALGSTNSETSPVQRGKVVWERLLCGELALPQDVDTTLPSAPADACKKDIYTMASLPACAGCHAVMEPIGFGLENYGPLGEFRTTEPGKPHCSIDGEGELPGAGTFFGAPGLASLILESGLLEPCLAQNFVQFAIGRTLDGSDRELIDTVADGLGDRVDFETMVLDFVESEGFRFRVEEGADGA